MKKSFTLIFFSILIFCMEFKAAGNTLEGFEFIDADIKEILFSVSMYSGISIVCDDTVSGNATFRYAGNDFESAFDSFLFSERLFVSKEEKIWTVSRIRLEETENGYELEALDVSAGRVIQSLSRKFKTAISFDSISSEGQCFYISGKNLKELLEGLSAEFGNDYKVEENQSGYSIRKNIKQDFYAEDFKGERLLISRSDDNLFSADIKSVSLNDALEELFLSADREYMFAENSFPLISEIKVSGKSFEELVQLLCSCCNFDFLDKDNVIYVFPENYERKSNFYDCCWKKINLSFISASDFLSCISDLCNSGSVKTVLSEDDKSFLIYGSSEVLQKVEEMIPLVDVRRNYETVELKYITVNEFLSHLPSGFKTSQFMDAGRNETLFFSGSSEEYKLLQEFLEKIDVPLKRLCYDLLVMQYQYTGEETWESTLTGRTPQYTDLTSSSAKLGSVLSLNLNVLATFGYDFALSLQTALNENKAKVFADTKVYGINGSSISFKNTSTYRYRDNNLDPETGEPIYTGITREIVSGLTVDVKGWISGDGMITSSVTASVSRQGTDLSSKTGNPPPTSEKVIATEVCGKNGEAIILSGLLQNEESESSQGLPLISRLPFAGKVFGSSSKNIEKTELVIYLVPHWLQEERGDEKLTDSQFASKLIRKYVKNN